MLPAITHPCGCTRLKKNCCRWKQRRWTRGDLSRELIYLLHGLVIFSDLLSSQEKLITHLLLTNWLAIILLITEQNITDKGGALDPIFVVSVNHRCRWVPTSHCTLQR